MAKQSSVTTHASGKGEADAPLPKEPEQVRKPATVKKPIPGTEGLPKAPAVVQQEKPKSSPRQTWEVVMVLGGERFGPFRPAQGAVDSSEAIQRVLDENPHLKPHLTKCRWVTKPLGSGNEQSQ